MLPYHGRRKKGQCRKTQQKSRDQPVRHIAQLHGMFSCGYLHSAECAEDSFHYTAFFINRHAPAFIEGDRKEQIPFLLHIHGAADESVLPLLYIQSSGKKALVNLLQGIIIKAVDTSPKRLSLRLFRIQRHGNSLGNISGLHQESPGHVGQRVRIVHPAKDSLLHRMVGNIDIKLSALIGGKGQILSRLLKGLGNQERSCAHKLRKVVLGFDRVLLRRLPPRPEILRNGKSERQDAGILIEKQLPRLLQHMHLRIVRLPLFHGIADRKQTVYERRGAVGAVRIDAALTAHVLVKVGHVVAGEG